MIPNPYADKHSAFDEEKPVGPHRTGWLAVKCDRRVELWDTSIVQSTVFDSGILIVYRSSQPLEDSAVFNYTLKIYGAGAWKFVAFKQNLTYSEAADQYNQPFNASASYTCTGEEAGDFGNRVRGL